MARQALQFLLHEKFPCKRTNFYDLQPSNVFFSHDRISHRLRNGIYLGDAMEAMDYGNLSPLAFPALDAGQGDGEVVGAVQVDGSIGASSAWRL